MPRIAVIGTGAWGTTIAHMLARAGHQPLLLGRDAAKVAQLANNRRHPSLSVPLADSIHITADATQLRDCNLVFWGVPTQKTRSMATALSAQLAPGSLVVSLAKGLEQDTHLRVSEILAATLGDHPCVVLSGPSMAEECANGQPVCLVAAGEPQHTSAVVDVLHGARSRLYTSTDLIGVEIGGALKNVVAIAAGICDGLQLGDNAKAAIITRGLAEMRRLGRALGAHDATFAGMAGIGDLLTSCYSPLGRNRSFGQAIATGKEAQTVLAQLSSVTEGAWTSRAATAMAKQLAIEVPIASQVANVIWSATPVPNAMENLLSRSPKEEDA